MNTLTRAKVAWLFRVKSYLKSCKMKRKEIIALDIRQKF